MTLASSTTGLTIATLPDLADSGADQQMLATVGGMVNFGLNGVQQDVESWLSWMLVGGSRPKTNKRTTNAEGVNAYLAAQDVLCAVLDQHARLIAWNNKAHFALIERATRPLPNDTKP